MRSPGRVAVRRAKALLLLACGAWLLSVAARGQAAEAAGYPSRPLRMILPFAPGGGADITARVVAQKLSESLGQQVVVDNRPGAGGNLGTELAARAVPDGYTIILVSSGYAANAALHKLSYDPVTGFAPITLVSAQPFIFVVNPKVPAANPREFIALARARPGTLNYASSGTGGIQHLATELFRSMAAIDVVHVPYKGGASPNADLLANQIQFTFGSFLATLPMVKAGQVRALAVTTAQRSPLLPDVPALAETGLPGFSVSGWYGVLAPAATPQPIVERLNREIVAGLKSPDVRDRLAGEGGMIIGSTPAQLTQHIRQEVSRWQSLVRQANIRLDGN